MTPRRPWSRENTIAIIAISVTVVGILLSLFSPDVRDFLHLNQSNATSSGVVDGNLNQTLQSNNTSTHTLPASSITPTQPPSNTSTPQPSTVYPHLASSYQGSVHNTTVGGTASLALVFIVQNQNL